MAQYVVAGALGKGKGARAFAGKMIAADSGEEAIQRAMAEEEVWFTATEVRDQKLVGAETQLPSRKALKKDLRTDVCTCGHQRQAHDEIGGCKYTFARDSAILTCPCTRFQEVK